MSAARKILTLACLVIPLLSAATNFKVLDISNGLSNNTVKCITQDNKGFMWFGTFDGLCRFDGIELTVFRNDNGGNTHVSANMINQLLPVPGGIWVGTGNGLFFFSFADYQFTPCSYLSLTGKEEPVDSYVYNILTVGEETFVLTNELLRLESGYRFKACDFVSKKSWKSMTTYKDSLILAHNDSGLFLLDPWNNHIIDRYEYIVPHSSDVIYYDDDSGLIYVGYGLGFGTKVFSITDGKIEAADASAPSDVKCIVKYNNEVLFGTDGKGVIQIQDNIRRSFSPGNTNISSDVIYSLYVDKDNKLWIGTYRGGVNSYGKSNDWFTNYTMRNSRLTHNFVTAIYQAPDDMMYLGMDGGGLNVFDPSTATVTAYNTANSKLPGNNVLSLAGDGRYVWMGIFGSGICRFDRTTGRFALHKLPADDGNLVWVIKNQGTDHLWVGTQAGLYLFNKQTETYEIVQKELIGITEIASGNNVLWVSTNPNGLYKTDLAGNILRHYHENDEQMPLPGNVIHCVFADSQGQVWFSIGHVGLCRLDKTEKNFTIFGRDNGLTNLTVVSISEDRNGFIWASTNDGLFRFNPQNERFVRFGEADNLSSTQFNYNACYNSGEEMYYGTTKGLIRFNPQDIVLNNAFQPVYFTDFLIFDGQEETDKDYWKSESEIRLPYDKRFFTIRYALPETTAPDKILFSCYLRNFDKEWREVTTDRKASYTNVPPGEYLFCVRATNTEGEWNKEYSSIKIVIRPPWWKSVPALILWTALLLAVLLFIFWFYQHELSNKHILKLKEMEKNTARSINEAKLSFFTNITHELRTPIFLITAPLEELLSSGKSVIQVQRSYLAGIYKNSMRLNKLISRIIDFRKLESGKLTLDLQNTNVVTFCRTLLADYEALCEQKNIVLHYLPAKVDINLTFDPEKLETILSNLIGNAVKYTSEGGKIILSIEEADDCVTFTVEDNGMGISKEYHEFIFDRFFQVDAGQAGGDGIGLSFVKNLVALHEGTIEVKSEPGKGSKFCFTIPNRIIANGTTATRPLLSEPESEHKKNAASIIHNPTARHTILIIDDEPETLNVLERALSEEYKVLHASNGIDGLVMVREYMPDIIVCDMMMPKMNGIEFVTALRADKNISRIPVIMFTAKTNEEDMFTAFDSGADAYLTKPVSIKYLRKRIEHLLSQTESMDIALFVTNTQTSYSKEEKKFLFKCKLVIDENLINPEFDVLSFAGKLGMSHSALYKKIKGLTGKSVIEFINEYRIYKAVQCFMEGETNITAVCMECGFNDIKNFRETFKKKMGVTPKQYLQEL